ncbi:MAG: Ig-like domain-containing protein [Firmicutes bacterium]|nr:Ig-like domain-containing protein [Bacillota bacterium]
MIFKKLTGAICAAAVFTSAFTAVTVSADDELEAISCTQSASYINNGTEQVLTLNTADTETPASISWNTTSGEWKGVGVLEFELPAMDPSFVKSAELTYSVYNGSSRSGGRTYDVYTADITIDADTTIDTLNTISLTNSIYTGEAVAQGQTRTDTVSNTDTRNHVRSMANAEEESKVQFAFSNSSQALTIDPSTASLKITLYGGGIAFDTHEMTMYTADSPVELEVGIYQDGISEEGFVWSSDNESVATVEDGVVTPHSAGTATISVTTSDGEYTDSCIFTVLQSAEGISLDKPELTLYTGGSAGELTAILTPENADDKAVVWESDNEEVAAVSDNGIVTPLAAGSAVITASATNGTISASCDVTVKEPVNAESITLDKTDVSLTKFGSTVSLHASVYPEDTDGIITWTSDNTDVAAVYDGVIVSNEVGSTVITASTSNGLTAECTVTVNDDDTLITNDMFYRDTDGNPIYAQGGGIFKFGDTYYWYGVRYTESVSYAADPLQSMDVEHPAFEAYTCYTSKDLVNWENQGDVATLETLGESWTGWAGRMGVVYHEGTDRYILVSQFNGTIIASADNPLGPFEEEKLYYWGSLPTIANNDTGDQTMFQDDDGKAYMICSSANGRSYLYVVPMDEDVDYCDFDFDNITQIDGSTGSYFAEDGSVKTKDKGGIEGDCMFKYNGKYYFTGSDLYGWHGSRVYVFQSDTIDGSYDIRPDYNISASDSTKKLPYIMKNVEDSYAHNSQAGFYYTIKGSEQETVLYCGDRWSGFCSNGLGFNQWVPLSFEGENDTPVFNNLSQWRLNAETGEWSIAEGNNYIANSYFDADRVALNDLTGWDCSDNIDGTATGNVKDKQYSGKYSARQSADVDYKATMKQNVENLPDGTYTLRASVKSSGGQNECLLYAVADGEEYSVSLKSEMSDWTEVVVKDIVVRNGECEVGLYSDAYAGNYVRLDDVYLTLNADSAEVMENVFDLRDADGNTVTALSANTDVHGYCSYYNDSSVTKNIAVYAVLYGTDGTIQSVKSANAEILPYTEAEIKTDALTLPSDTAGSYIKLFFWNDGLEPVSAALEIN